VFIVILLCLMYVRDQAISKQAAEERARTCAWLYSAQDCRGPLPEGCADVLREASGSDASGDLGRSLDESLRELERGGSGASALSSAIGALLRPTLGDVLGRTVEANTTQPVARARIFGSGQGTVSGRYRLACNLHPTTPGEVAQDAWKKIRPW
jgi:hypothetical protein